MKQYRLGTPRTLGIVRVSSKKQGDNNSPGVQGDGIKSYALAEGLELVDVIVIEESAKSSETRVKFRAALERAKKENVRHIVVWVWDRSTRNFTDYELLEQLIHKDDFVLHIAHERWPLHADSPEGDWLKAEMNTIVAKTYSRQLSRRAKESQDAKARDGWYPTRPPLGYRNAKLVGTNGVMKDRGGTIELLPAGRALLRRMFDLRVAGTSLEAIGQAIVAEGLWTAVGKPARRVRASEVDQLLKHEFYAGYFVWRGERYQGKHEPVFTRQEWERLQATFGDGAPRGTPLVKAGVFQGFLTCAECGCQITYDPKTKKSGKVYEYYRCADGVRFHQKRVHVTESNLLGQFEAAIAEITIPDAVAAEVARVLRETHDAARAGRKREIAALKRAVEHVEKREDELTNRLLDGKLDDIVYARQQQRLASERQEAVDRLARASEHLDDRCLVTTERIFELAKQSKSLWKRRSPTEQRELLEMLLSNPRLEGVSARWDMKKPFAILAEMAKGGQWRGERYPEKHEQAFTRQEWERLPAR
jgi:site-specific DNA recombinase